MVLHVLQGGGHAGGQVLAAGPVRDQPDPLQDLQGVVALGPRAGLSLQRRGRPAPFHGVVQLPSGVGPGTADLGDDPVQDRPLVLLRSMRILAGFLLGDLLARALSTHNPSLQHTLSARLCARDFARISYMRHAPRVASTFHESTSHRASACYCDRMSFR